MAYKSKWRTDIETLKKKLKKYGKDQIIFKLDKTHKIKFKRRKLTEKSISNTLLKTSKIESWEEQIHGRKKIRHRVTYKKSNNYKLVVVFEFTDKKIKIITAFPRDMRMTKRFKKFRM